MLLDNLLLLTPQKFNESVLNFREKSPEKNPHAKTIASNRRNFNHFMQTINPTVAYVSRD